MTLGLVLTAVSLGIRHGIDWDHIAAISDLTSSAESRRDGFLMSLLYSLGHAGVVFVLGTAAIIFGSSVPESVDAWMGRVVGATLIALGLWVVVQLFRHGRDFRLRSRWMLVLSGVFVGLRRVRTARSDRKIEIAHDHQHEHDGEEFVQIHDHAHSTVGTPEPVPEMSSTRRGLPWGRSLTHSHRHQHELTLPADPFTSYRGRTATGIGILHGIGIESPTQIAVFVAATSVTGTRAGLALLVAWVAGLLVANAGLAGLAAVGLLQADRSFVLYAAVAVIVAIASIAVGIALVFGIGELPGIAP